MTDKQKLKIEELPQPDAEELPPAEAEEAQGGVHTSMIAILIGAHPEPTNPRDPGTRS